MSAELSGECYSCARNSSSDQARHERIYDDGLWRVAHAFNSVMLGWLVIVLQRHATSMSELTANEATNLGQLIASLSSALETELSVDKAYVIFVAEQPGFQHVHVHVVARPQADARGMKLFELLQRPQSEWVSTAEMDAFSDRFRRHLASRA